MPDDSSAPLMTSAGTPKSFGQSVDESRAGQMRARGTAGNIDAARVAAEARGILVHPGDRAAHLLGHRHQAAAGVDHVDEVGHDEMRAGMHEQLGRVAELPGFAGSARRRRG